MTNFTIGNWTLYERLEQEYFFQTYVWREAYPLGMYGDIKAWVAANITSTIFDSWYYDGYPDFLPASYITNSTFSNVDVDGAVLSLKDSRVIMRTTTFEDNLLRGKESSTLKVSGGHTNLDGEVSFRNNVADTGAAIALSNKAEMIGQGTVFDANVAMNHGGVFMLREALSLSLDNAIFTNNTATNIGGVIWARKGQAVTTITISDTSFTDNRAGSSLVNLDTASMSVINSAFVNNFADDLTHGFTLQAANLTISNTIVRNQNE